MSSKLDAMPAAKLVPAPFAPLQFVPQVLPGVALAGVVALAATFVSTLHGGPQLP